MSCVKIIEYQDYKALDVIAVQEILKEKHIVITGYPLEQVVRNGDPVAFDEVGMQHLRNLDMPIKFQGNVLSNVCFVSRNSLTGYPQISQSELKKITLCRSALECWTTF